MARFFRILILCAVLAVPAGCASDGSFVNPFESTEPSSGSPYYFSEFSDVPIPNDMSEKRGETFITFAPSGIKCGVQLFSGRLDIVALMNAMRRNMANNGWTLRSLLRSNESVLVFEKSDRFCTMALSDGVIFTDLRVFVSPRLEGDTGADISAFSPPLPSGSAGASSSGQQKLSQ